MLRHAVIPPAAVLLRVYGASDTRGACRNKVEESPLYVENTLRKEAVLAQAVASGQAAREQACSAGVLPDFPWRQYLTVRYAMQRDALRGESMAVEQPNVSAAPEAGGSSAMEVDSRPGK